MVVAMHKERLAYRLRHNFYQAQNKEPPDEEENSPVLWCWWCVAKKKTVQQRGGGGCYAEWRGVCQI